MIVYVVLQHVYHGAQRPQRSGILFDSQEKNKTHPVIN